MKSNVMKRAWEIAKNAAKKFGHSVKSYISLALKAAWAEVKGAVETIKPVCERIDELVALGFNRWQKGSMDRLYINANMLGLVVNYRRTGTISAAWFNGDEISNSEAYRMKGAKTFIDVKTGLLYGDNDQLCKAAAKLARVEMADD